VKEVERSWHVERKGKKRNTCSILVMKLEGKRALVKTGSIWKIILKWIQRSRL
jgi:hypothetical protein